MVMQKNEQPDYYAFVAVFEMDEEEGVCDFGFPDLSNCFGNAPSLSQAMLEAKEALENVLYWMERDGVAIPEPKETLESRKGVVKNLVVADMRAARRAWRTRSVNRTVTLPGWLDEAGRAANLNFSQILQDGIKQALL